MHSLNEKSPSEGIFHFAIKFNVFGCADSITSSTEPGRNCPYLLSSISSDYLVKSYANDVPEVFRPFKLFRFLNRESSVFYPA